MLEQNRLKLIQKLVEKVKKEGVIRKSDKFLNSQSVIKLRKEFGNKKNIPKHYETQILKALSYYPELKDEKISFVVTKAMFSMETQLKPWTILHKKRHYVIKINRRIAHTYFNKFSEETCVALLCHELAHVVDYKNKNFFSMTKFGFVYLVPFSRRKIEFETDIRSILHGAGYFLIKHRSEIKKNLEHIAHNKKKINFLDQYYDSFYMREDEIFNMIKTYNLD